MPYLRAAGCCCVYRMGNLEPSDNSTLPTGQNKACPSLARALLISLVRYIKRRSSSAKMDPSLFIAGASCVVFYILHTCITTNHSFTLRIGHTRFSHSYLLNREDQPRCTYCDCALTVVHMLLECPHSSLQYCKTEILFHHNSKDLFETVNTHSILDFIKDIGFYNRI